MTAPGCSDLAALRGEPLAGTASVLTSFLLLEHPAPWRADAVARVAAETFGEDAPALLADLWAAHRFRLLLLRRPGRSGRRPGTSPVAYLGTTAPGAAALRRLPAAELGQVDLRRIAAGEAPWGEPEPEPLLAVCTNGSVDRCCAVRGRPLVAALAERYPRHTWEVTHLGGCRFAANLLVLPGGQLYGALTPERGVAVAEAALAGRPSPAHWRGHTALGDAAATAVAGLRSRLGPGSGLAASAVEVVAERESRGPDGLVTGAWVWLTARGTLWRAQVGVREVTAPASACHPATGLPQHVLVDLAVVSAASPSAESRTAASTVPPTAGLTAAPGR